MAYAASMAINASPASIGRARSTLTRVLYLKRVMRLLESSPRTILSQLDSIRSALAQHSNFRFANVENLVNPVSFWKIFTSDLDSSKPLIPSFPAYSRGFIPRIVSVYHFFAYNRQLFCNCQCPRPSFPCQPLHSGSDDSS